MTETGKTCVQCGAEMAADEIASLCAKCLLQIGFETQPGNSSNPDSSAYQPVFVAPTPAELAPHFPQLEILEQIGHGGMGVVYQARQTELDRIVALKILRPGISGDPGFAERFQREARALAKLNHPNIITVYDFGRTDGLFYFVMEYVDGTNLRHLERTGNLGPQEALKIVPQVCAALQYAHDNGVVHRDIKPENILINKDGELRIADFGLAKLAGVTDGAPLTGTWQVMGTPHYMAPEQFEKPNTVDHRADIYSLGVVIYELLTGELPLGRFRRPSEKVRVDVRLDEVVLRSLDKEPDRRYQRVTDVATAVEQASAPPDDTSRTDQATAWLRDKAAAVRNYTATLTQKTGGWRNAVGGRADWLVRRKFGIAGVLMWCGIAELLLALLPFPGSLPVSRDERSFIAFMTCVTGGLAIFLGRRLRRADNSPYLRLAAVFCLIPWFTFPPVSLLRVILSACALIILIRDNNPGSESDRRASDSAGPDVLDRLTSMALAVRRTISIRACLFTIFGLAGWCGICVVTILSVYELTYRNNAPTEYFIRDRTAWDTRPVSDAYKQLRVESTQRGAARGFDHDRIAYARDNIDLTIYADQSLRLHVDFRENECELLSHDKSIVQHLPVSRATVTEWMERSGVDTGMPVVELEIAHLLEIVQLMGRTRGIYDRLSMSDREKCPSLSKGISDLLNDDRLTDRNVIPLWRLLDRELFVCSPDSVWPTQNLRMQTSAQTWYMVTAIPIFLIGLLRVCRVLYKHLWRNAVRSPAHTDQAAVSPAISRWRTCSLGLVIVGVVCALAAAECWWKATAVGDDQTWFFERIQIDVPYAVMEWILAGFLCVGIAISLLGLLARPLFRGYGWWLGFAGGALALFTLPFCLLTFPTGLAAWILLTDTDLRHRFGYGDRTVDGGSQVTGSVAGTAIVPE